MESVKGDTKQDIKSFKDFYPYYLSNHRNQTNCRLHVVSTTVMVTLALLSVFFGPHLLLIGFFFGMCCAWTGHFIFEKNKPSSWEYPYYGIIGDLKLWYQTITGERPF